MIVTEPLHKYLESQVLVALVVLVTVTLSDSDVVCSNGPAGLLQLHGTIPNLKHHNGIIVTC